MLLLKFIQVYESCINTMKYYLKLSILLENIIFVQPLKFVLAELALQALKVKYPENENNLQNSFYSFIKKLRSKIIVI